MKSTIPTTKSIIIFWSGNLSKINVFTMSNWTKKATIINPKRIIMSIILSAIIDPKPLSKGTLLYFFSTNALEISPDLGTVKFIKYPMETAIKLLANVVL